MKNKATKEAQSLVDNNRDRLSLERNGRLCVDGRLIERFEHIPLGHGIIGRIIVCQTEITKILRRERGDYILPGCGSQYVPAWAAV